jgi:hypothetical protein
LSALELFEPDATESRLRTAALFDGARLCDGPATGNVDVEATRGDVMLLACDVRRFLAGGGSVEAGATRGETIESLSRTNVWICSSRRSGLATRALTNCSSWSPRATAASRRVRSPLAGKTHSRSLRLQ